VIQRYFRKTRATTVVGHLPTALTGATAAVLDDQLFLVGGESGGVLSDAIWRIDEPGRATLVGHLPEGRANAALVMIDPTTAWLIGGRTPQRDPAPSAVVLSAKQP
jgi:N-acetylneuraminic acid mutarotase